ncbi:hypothetical protein, conserved [Eimeria maxima]|uniref:Uncharacterized protein n=1 Tax=Eimeria maxima TaxID=5804 RepID=U6MG76_EIMMA|nr:hypothetical protein, conserved [Eimeria maxima]CDJ60645.1 hypothetical protein, conserved [Eimeria maxima]
MPAEFIAPVLLAKGAAGAAGANFLGGAGQAALAGGLGAANNLIGMTPMGMAAGAIGNAAGAIGQQAAAAGAAGAAPDVVEQALYFLPLFAPLLSTLPRNVRSEEQRTIRLSTADSRGARNKIDKEAERIVSNPSAGVAALVAVKTYNYIIHD